MASCKQLAAKYGGTAGFYNAESIALARRVCKASGIKPAVRTDGSTRLWPILYTGRNATGEDFSVCFDSQAHRSGRRFLLSRPAFALTFKLLLTSDGRKMGKTEKGALWLDPNRTSPYEFYQYWRNVDDADVEKCLALLTFLPMDEVRRLGALKDAAINEAKRVLAFEVTKLIHGEEEAVKARDAAEALFGGGAMGGSVPTTALTAAELAEESRLVALLARAGLCKSNGEARKTIQQGGVTVNDEKVTDVDFHFTPEMLSGEGALVRKGKKSYHRFKLA